MRKIFFLVIVGIVLAPAVWAQGPAKNSNDYPKLEGAATFTYGSLADNSGTEFYTEGPDHFTIEPCTADGKDFLGSKLQGFICNRRGFRGFDGSVTYNLNKYIGIKGNVSGLYKTTQVVDHFDDNGTARTDTNVFTERTYNFLGGLQFKDNRRRKDFRPFAHALFGVARFTQHDVQTSTGGFNFTLDDRLNSFAMKLGGGMDLRMSARLDLRLIEVNYNPIFAKARNVAGDADFELRNGGRRANNITFSVGIVFH